MHREHWSFPRCLLGPGRVNGMSPRSHVPVFLKRGKSKAFAGMFRNKRNPLRFWGHVVSYDPLLVEFRGTPEEPLAILGTAHGLKPPRCPRPEAAQSSDVDDGRGPRNAESDHEPGKTR